MKTQRIRFMFIVVTLFALTTSIKSQSIYHMVHFDVSSPSNVLDFDYTFKEFTSIQYNLPLRIILQYLGIVLFLNYRLINSYGILLEESKLRIGIMISMLILHFLK